jgi:hypothetical protein
VAPPIIAPMPEWLDLAGAYTIRFDAVSAGTGATVASVVVSDASIFGDAPGTSGVGSIEFGPFMLVAGPGE